MVVNQQGKRNTCRMRIFSIMVPVAVSPLPLMGISTSRKRLSISMQLHKLTTVACLALVKYMLAQNGTCLAKDKTPATQIIDRPFSEPRKGCPTSASWSNLSVMISSKRYVSKTTIPSFKRWFRLFDFLSKSFPHKTTGPQEFWSPHVAPKHPPGCGKNPDFADVARAKNHGMKCEGAFFPWGSFIG